MNAVWIDVPPSLLEERRRRGLDRFDEVWEGVLHMSPAPSVDHQDREWELTTWLRRVWAKRVGGRVVQQVNLSDREDWQENFRIPDVCLLGPDRLAVNRRTFFLGPPTAVVEIRSPGDETYEKLDFYAALGVPEVWIIDRDSRRLELQVLRDGAYVEQAGDADGWTRSAATGVEFRPADGARLTLRLAGDAATEATIPDAV